MAANQLVLVPDQSHHDNVEGGQHYEADAVRVREAVELVDDEEAKDDKRNGIGPELISKQTDDEENLNDAVAEEIEGIEALGADGKNSALGLRDVLQQSHLDLRSTPPG